MKKLTVLAFCIAALLCAGGCSRQGNSVNEYTTPPKETKASVSTEAAETTAPAVTTVTDLTAETAETVTTTAVTAVSKRNVEKLENKMTENELSRAEKRALTLLDDPEDAKHTVSIMFETMSTDEAYEMLEDHKINMPEEAYEKGKAEIDKCAKEGRDYVTPYVTMVDHCYYSGITPNMDYDGGELSIYTAQGEERTELKFANLEEYIEYVKKKGQENGVDTDHEVKAIRLVFDAVMNKTYETIPEGSLNMRSMPTTFYNDPFTDFRSTWKYDREEVSAIRDSIDEYQLYDDELATDFLIQVTLPPNYDKNKTYPVLLLTDGVWRFGDCPALRRLMENGECADVLLVSLGYGYQFDGTSEFNRFTHLLEGRDQLLRFVTDNLMPYLGEQYHIDYANSTLYGHSNGGVFSHNALCKSDQYENQPFGRYIIGSPAFWALYDESYPDLDPEGCETDYGYLERHEKPDKKVFLCGGKDEDADFSDKYNGHATTLEGLSALKERLEAHGAELTYQLYDSHHDQYISDMLKEYLKTEYPKQ